MVGLTFKNTKMEKHTADEQSTTISKSQTFTKFLSNKHFILAEMFTTSYTTWILLCQNQGAILHKLDTKLITQKRAEPCLLLAIFDDKLKSGAI